MLRYLVIVLVLVCDIESKICNSIRASNGPHDLEQIRNCHIIAGSLKILLFDAVKNESAYDNKTFPELEEVAEFVFMYNVHKLKSLNRLFPNLKTIRGVKLFADYSLIIYDNPDIEEIGLTSLTYVARGNVIIEKNPKICHVDSIDWKALGTKVKRDRPFCEDTCNQTCNNNCWNYQNCQKRYENCHSECVGCTQPQSQHHCIVCRNFNNTGECVHTCPKNKFTNKYLFQCLTKEECTDGWFLFKDECIRNCPIRYINDSKLGCKLCDDSCVKVCPPIIVDTKSSIEKLEGCTHINGSLDIRISDVDLVNSLEHYLGFIREINGALNIGRSSVLKNLKFLNNLRLINGEPPYQKYALFIYQNDELQELWDFDKLNLTVQNGILGIFNNPLLCMTHIEKLNETTKATYEIDIVTPTNGYEASCNIKDLQIRLTNISSTNVTFIWQPYSNLSENESVIGYAIYYKINDSNKNVTKRNNYGVCGSDGWESVYASNFTNFTLTKLEPYKMYSYYFITYLGNSGPINLSNYDIKTPNLNKIKLRDNRQISTTPQFFNTTASDPSEVLNFIALPISSDIIELKWEKSAIPNGILSYYQLSVYKLIDQIQEIEQRDYCKYPITEDTKAETKSNDLKNITTAAVKKIKCACEKEDEETSNTLRILNLDHVVFCDIKDNVIMQKTNKACYNNLYTIEKDENTISDDTFIVHSDNMVNNIYNSNNIIDRLPDRIINDSSKTTFQVKNLQQYTLYYFVISVCNEPINNLPLCSSVTSAFARTLKSEHSDDIQKVDYRTEDNHHIFSWQEPQHPNSIIVSYSIDVKREDNSFSHPVIVCITREDHIKNNSMYKILNILPGKYKFSVRATSIAGPGHYTEPIIFFVPDPSTSKLWIIILVLVMVFLSGVIITYLWCRKKISVDNVHLITSINPDYAVQYIEDELEVDRSDVEVLGEIGQGTFGMVYKGRIKSKDIMCALKTVNETASLTDRLKFLNEASVMKSFSKAHHVVKLLGVVSRGQPPLVIMELMDHGDLKLFLRRSRDSSQNITTNEMYKMAAEIADGMAYLAIKKFVHRDLAARNCMVAEDLTVKVGDFGMARDIYETDYYRKETKGLFPVRWMAPESLADGVFTSDSDVWSYGVVLWEMATFAEQPYQGLGNEEVLQFVVSKGTLQRPQNCPDLLYEIMSACWKWRPIDRPLFTDIVSELEDHVSETFKLKSFYHNAGGEDWRMMSKERVNNPPAMGLTNPYTRYNAYNENVNLLIDGHGSDSLLTYPNQRRSQVSISNNYLGQSSSASKYSDNSLDSS